MTRRTLIALLAALSVRASALSVEIPRVTAAAPAAVSAAGAASAALHALSVSPVAASASLSAAAPALAAPVAARAAEPAPSPRTYAAVSAHVESQTRSWGVPVEKILKDRDVLVVGEDHASLSTIETLAREMPRLAKAGVTAVGIEGLKRPAQDAVDAYVSRRTSVFPRDALNFSPARADAFESMIAAARANGVRVVALGLPLDHWADMVTKLAANKTDDPQESFRASLPAQVDRAETSYEPGFNEALAEVLLTRRNRSMAGFIAQSVRGGGKAVIVAGQAHVAGPDPIAAARFHVEGDYGDLARELSAWTLRAYSLTFTGGLFTSAQAAQDDVDVRPEAHKAAAAASPKGAPVFVPLGPDEGLWHAGGRIAAPSAR